MSKEKQTFGEFMFAKIVRGIRSVEYVDNMDDIRSKKVAPPLQGARVDGHVEIMFLGPMVKGTGTGVDYANYRADGLIELHVHEEIATEDGAKIAAFSNGIGYWEDGALHVRENLTFFAGDRRYAWLNRVLAWGQGKSSPEGGGLRIEVYAANGPVTLLSP